MIEAITAAGDVVALAAAIKARETRRIQLVRDLAALEQLHAMMARFDARGVETDLRRKLADWRALLGQHTPVARQMVLKLLDGGRILWTPRPEAGCYEFTGRTVLDKLLAGVVWPNTAVTQVWRARQDSNLRPSA